MVAAGVSTLVLVVFVVGVLAFVLCRNHRRKKKIHLLLLVCKYLILHYISYTIHISMCNRII